MEDLGCPGEFHFELEKSAAILLLGAGKKLSSQINLADSPAGRVFETVHNSELNRRQQITRIERSAQQYIVKRQEGKTIIAGYPLLAGRIRFLRG